jgi:hypothetical protein
MNNNIPFDFSTYLEQLTKQNKLCKNNNFIFCTASGINYLEGILENFRKSKAFICCSDVTEGGTSFGPSNWYNKRVLTAFILHRFRQGNTTDYNAKLQLCREIYTQFMSKMLKDEDDNIANMDYLDTHNVIWRELGGTFLNGCTGLYFMISLNEPVNLAYDEQEWTTE